jgi:hypothetical protein
MEPLERITQQLENKSIWIFNGDGEGGSAMSFCLHNSIGCITLPLELFQA